MLHTINTKGWSLKTAWCVPTAISFISGSPLIHTHSRAAFMGGINLEEVKGVAIDDAIVLLHEQGFVSKQICLRDRFGDEAPTLKEFMNSRTAYEMCVPLFIVIEKKPSFCHAVALHFNYLADNWTMKPTHVDEFPNNDAFVTAAFVAEKKQ